VIDVILLEPIDQGGGGYLADVSTCRYAKIRASTVAKVWSNQEGTVHIPKLSPQLKKPK
jgi:hypothetical protein